MTPKKRKKRRIALRTLNRDTAVVASTNQMIIEANTINPANNESTLLNNDNQLDIETTNFDDNTIVEAPTTTTTNLMDNAPTLEKTETPTENNVDIVPTTVITNESVEVPTKSATKRKPTRKTPKKTTASRVTTTTRKRNTRKNTSKG